MYHPKVYTIHTVYEDSFKELGVGINCHGHEALVVRIKPEGVTWAYDLKDDFDKALGRLDHASPQA